MVKEGSLSGFSNIREEGISMQLGRNLVGWKR